MKCERCGDDFTPDRPNQKRFCSNTCRHRHSNAQARARKMTKHKDVTIVWHGQHIELISARNNALLKVIWLKDYDYDAVKTYNAALNYMDKMKWQASHE